MKGSGGGEIVQVEGGHIVRSIGRKDRHSKVYTAKGPRDRRVRLSAQTAIQFYDVQDRLGYDRPSKAVDWLIKKAKSAIDKLGELPPWNPSETTLAANTEPDLVSSSMGLEQQHSESSSGYAFQLQKQLDENQNTNPSLMPPPSETQCIADSMKSFFPTSSGTSLMNFQNPIQAEDDLGLSLHTIQETNSSHSASADHQVHFSSPNPLGFEANYAKTTGWGGVGSGDNRMGFIFSCPQTISHHHPFFQSSSSSSAIPQREPLQSNYSHMIHAWNNRSLPPEDQLNAQSSISSSHFTPEFQVPGRIQGEEEEPGVFSLRPSSSSSISHY